MRILKRVLAILAVLLACGVVFLGISVSRALDWDRTHSSASVALPFYGPDKPDGLYQIRANGLVFRARVYGASNNGAAIVMLHGHPETSIMWHSLAQKAADRGFRVIAFDQRGYSPGARPDGVENYIADKQISDVVAIADAAGFDRFHLVGHDWGAIIAWSTAMFHRDRIASLSTLSLPHPQTLKAKVVDETPAYVRVFALPWVPEAMLLFNDLSGYRDTYSEQSDEEISEYLSVFAEPGASTATLNWYRAIQDSLVLLDAHNPRVCAPTIFIYGDKEFWVTPEYLTQQRGLVDSSYSETELPGGHWLIQQHPDQISDMILAHITVSESNLTPSARGCNSAAPSIGG